MDFFGIVASKGEDNDAKEASNGIASGAKQSKADSGPEGPNSIDEKLEEGRGKYIPPFSPNRVKHNIFLL